MTLGLITDQLRSTVFCGNLPMYGLRINHTNLRICDSGMSPRICVLYAHF
jgi:hypothetical protein